MKKDKSFSSSAGGGFQRGFLLSKPKKKKRAPTSTSIERPEAEAAAIAVPKNTWIVVPTSKPTTSTASSVLLDLERQTSTTETRSNSFLRVLPNNSSHQQNEKAQHSMPEKNPLLVVDISESTPPPPQRDASFISNSNDNRRSMNDDETTAPPIMVEIKASTTIRRKKNSFISQALFVDEEDARRSTDEHYHGPAITNNRQEMHPNLMTPGIDQASEKTTFSTAEDENDIVNTTTTTTNFIQCQHNLDRTLWKLRRKKQRQRKPQQNDAEDWQIVASKFCSSVIPTTELLPWLWQSLLMACPKQSSQCLAELRLASILFESTQTPGAWQIFAKFLQISTDKQHRICTLGAVTILDFWCTNQQTKQDGSIPVDPIISSAWLIDVLQNVLPPLGQQVTGQPIRTVLAQRCITTIYQIVATVVDILSWKCTTMDKDKSERKGLEQTLWNVTQDVLGPAWDTQLGWVASTDSTNVRVDCTMAVLRNWKQMMHRLRNEEKDKECSRRWCRLLRGVELQNNDLPIGGLRQTLLKTKFELSENDALNYIERALTCGKSFFDEHHDTRSPETANEQILLVQGVVAWLGQSKDLQLTRHQELFEMSITLVLYAIDESVAKLAVHILDYLWEKTVGVQIDAIGRHLQSSAEEPQKEMTASLSFWLELIRQFDQRDAACNESDTDVNVHFLETSQDTLCRLIMRQLLGIYSIAGGSKIQSIVASLVSENGMTSSTTKVLFLILKGIQGGVTDINDATARFLQYIVNDLLLGHFDSTTVRRLIQQQHEEGFDPLSCDANFSTVVFKTRLLAALTVSNQSDNAASILVTSLTMCLEKDLVAGKTAAVTTIEHVFKALVNLSKPTDTISSKLSKELAANEEQAIERSSACLGEAWRKFALSEASHSCSIEDGKETVFGRLLTAVAKVMFLNPGSTVPLTFVGAVFGDNESFWQDSNSKGCNVIMSAVLSLLVAAVEELDALCTQTKRSNPGSEESDVIFSRLAPLLLLRRTPARPFQEAFNLLAEANATTKSSLKDLLWRLGNHLAVRLDIFTGGALAPSIEIYLPQERQLAAEVAGRCLPFNGTPGGEAFSEVSCFQRLSVPVFSELISMLHTKGGADSGEEENCASRSKIREARAALYATCHFMPFANSCKYQLVDEGLLSTAAVCLLCLDADQEVFEAPNLEQDFLQLQSGCIEFFAVCIENSLHTKKSSAGNETSLPAFSTIYYTLLEIIQKGCISKTDYSAWLGSALARIVSDGTVGTANLRVGAVQYSSPCCTCLWNSLIVVSQRCPDESGKLQVLASTMLPWLVAWGAGATQSSSTKKTEALHRHTLCVTAALQLAFILVTRSKSFGGLPMTSSTTSSSIQSLHRSALAAIQDGRGATDYASEALRCAGLKVLLALVTIGQSNNSNQSLVFSPKEMKATFATLQEVAKHDCNPKLQALAYQILAAVAQ